MYTYQERMISGTKREGIIGGWRKLHNEELHNLHSSLFRVIKSRNTRWAGHVTRTGEMRELYIYIYIYICHKISGLEK
jgi:hypothetical protein